MDIKMYNSEQKEIYLKSNPLNATQSLQYFGRIRDKEDEYQKDCTEMTFEEIKDSLLFLEIRSLSSRRHVISLLRMYAEWVVGKGIINHTPFINIISPDDIFSETTYRRQMLEGPKQVKHILNTCYPNNYSYDRSNRDSAVLWLLYSGMTIEELSSLTIKHIDCDKNVIRSPIYNDILYKVTSETVSYCEKVNNMDGIKRKGSNIYNEFKASEYLFKPIQTIRSNRKSKNHIEKLGFFAIVKYIFNLYADNSLDKEKNFAVSPNNIRISGLYFKIYQDELQGKGLTIYMFADYFNIQYETKEELFVKIKNTIEEYYEWKKAFYK